MAKQRTSSTRTEDKPPPVKLYGDGPRDFGLEKKISSDPDVWAPVRDANSWGGWIWRWTLTQARDELAACEKDGGTYRILNWITGKVV